MARSGAGSLRVSLTLLDQAIVYSKNFVDLNTVTGMLGIIEPSLLEKLLTSIYDKNSTEILAFIRMASDYEAEMILDELTLHIKGLLLAGDTTFTPTIIERFFRVIAESKSLLALGSDGEFVLTLSLFKMMEALEIKDIDAMIRGLEKELKGIEVSEVMLAEPVRKIQANTEVPSVTQDAQNKMQTPSPVQNDASKPEVETDATNKKEVSTEPIASIMPSASLENSENAVDESIEVNKLTEPTKVAEVNPYQKIFDTLVEKIYDRNHDLGTVFENNISFVSFEENKLTWESSAEDAEKKQLVTHWGVINMFVKDFFGFETKIVNISKKKAPITSSEQVAFSSDTTADKESKKETKAPHNNTDTGSTREDMEMKSSCIAPSAGDTEAAKEKDPSTLLQEPMVKEAIALFDPKKVRIKRNS